MADEFQRFEAYNRCGSIMNWYSPDPMDPNAEYRRGDFFDLKKLDGFDHDTISAMIRCYQYWIAVSDCDGFRIDAAKHIPKELCQKFGIGVSRFAQSIGKKTFYSSARSPTRSCRSTTCRCLGACSIAP